MERRKLKVVSGKRKESASASASALAKAESKRDERKKYQISDISKNKGKEVAKAESKKTKKN